jgi:hypothetical protein
VKSWKKDAANRCKEGKRVQTADAKGGKEEARGLSMWLGVYVHVRVCVCIWVGRARMACVCICVLRRCPFVSPSFSLSLCSLTFAHCLRCSWWAKSSDATGKSRYSFWLGIFLLASATGSASVCCNLQARRYCPVRSFQLPSLE